MPDRARQREHGRGRGGFRGGPRLGLAEVYNPSMIPTLLPGDRLLVRYGAQVQPGDVVVLRHPFQHDLLIVKRVVAWRPGGWWVQGDNPGSEHDSREFGAVPPELVVARAAVRLRPPRVGQSSKRPVVSVLRWVPAAVRPLARPRRFRAR